MIQSLVLAFLVASPVLDKPRFDFFGPMNSVMVPGGKIAPVDSGIRFNIEISNGGSEIGPTQFDLTPSGSDKAIHLVLSGLALVNGHLTGQAEITNTSGTSIQGVRLDMVRLGEFTKSASGQLTLHSLPCNLASPLSFGDFGDGETNGQLPIDLSGIAFKPDTDHFMIEGCVSGERFVRAMDLPTIAGDGQIDVDAKGNIYLADVVANCVSRVDGNGKNPTQLCKLPDQCKGMAVNPKIGDIAANCANHPTIYFFDSSGVEKGKLADDTLDNYPDFHRFDANGRLWSNVGSKYVGFDASNKPNATISKFGDLDPIAGRFDVAPDGTMYAVTEDSVLVHHPDGKGGLFAKGHGDKLGQLFGVKSVRVGPDGLVYVAEDGANNVPLCTITVFTPGGQVVRAFGRGAKKAMDNFPDGYWPAQLYRPSDIAFGRDGLVYVNCQSRDANGGRVMVFAPF